MPGQPIAIDVLIVTYLRPLKLERCLKSLFAAASACPEVSLRVLVGINGEREGEPGGSAEVLRHADEEPGNPQIEGVRLPDRLPPGAARNRLVDRVRADWILFIDDDVFMGSGFFRTFLELRAQRPEAVAIGGPNLTPEDSSHFQRASGAVLASRLGSSRVARRYSPRGRKTVDCGEESLILCNLFVKSAMIRDFPFPEDLSCAEENWVLQGLRKSGHQLIASPRLFLWHERRGSPTGFARQIFKYGFGRGQLLRRRPRDLRWHHALPPVFVLCVSYLLLRTLITAEWGISVRLFFGVYGGFCLAGGLGGFFLLKESGLVSLLSSLLHPLVHFSYGAGVLAGAVRRK